MPFGSTELQILPGAQVGRANGFVPVTEHDVAVARGTAQPYFQDEAFGGVVYRIYTTKFPGQSGVLVRVAQPTSDSTSTQTALGWLLIALVPVAAVGAAVTARLAAGRVLRPVGRLTETVERIRATGDLGTPIETPTRSSFRGPGRTGTSPRRDEISRLGQAFAAMTAALDESVNAQRRLVSDASHELRTPLTSLTTNLELLAEGPGDPSAPQLAAAALAEAGALRVLINDLVDLARDGQASFHVEDVRLDLVAEHVAARAARRVPELAIRTRLPADPGPRRPRCAGTGNRQPGRQRAEMEPARWPDPHLDRQRHGRGQRRRTRNPAEDLPYIFDRFYRSASARALPGSGLGLAIVRRIIDLHDGTVEAIPLPQGAQFRLTLPETPLSTPMIRRPIGSHRPRSRPGPKPASHDPPPNVAP